MPAGQILWKRTRSDSTDAVEIRVAENIYTIVSGTPTWIDPAHRAAVIAKLTARGDTASVTTLGGE